MPVDGKVYFVGAGPGDPGLITVRGLELVKMADAIVYDKLIPESILSYARPDAELHYVGKEAGKHTLPQEEINALLCRLAKEGKSVVRLKGGDPFIFGRGGEEALEVKQAGLKFEVVCGVTSGAAVPVYAGIPVTHRGIATSLHFITGHEDPTKPEAQVNYDALAKVGGTLVFFMGVDNLAQIASELIKHGKPGDTPCAVIQRGCTPHQRTVTGTLSEIARIAEESKIEPPAIICIGDVCKLRNELAWYENTPLFGKSVVVTRSRAQASALSSRLLALGAEVIELPTIEIVPAKLPPDDLAKLEWLANYDWIIFTSQNVVPPFFDNLSSLGLDARAFAGAKIAAIGGATVDALHHRGLNADLIPQAFTSAGLLEAFKAMNVIERGRKVLLPRADIASRELPDGLARLGMEVTEVSIYRTIPAEPDIDTLKRITKGNIDYFTFASSSTAENLARLIGAGKFIELSKKSRFISIGPVTSATIRKLGARVSWEAERSDINGLVEAILDDAGVAKE
jgi:uroporphyrinogen III methyltransferase/synthase